jgi:ribosomal protein S3AE
MAERKKFIEVEIPLLGNSFKVLGSLEELKGKTIKMDLTRMLRGKGLTLTFKIFQEENKLFAVPYRLELVRSYIKRIMRKRIDYVEDSFKGQCADISATIKPFLITRKKVSRAVRKNLRNTAKEFIIEYIKEKEFNEVCKELKNGTFQKVMLPKLKKVYPLSFCDIRVFETKDIEKIDLKKAIKEEAEEIYEEDSYLEDEEEKESNVGEE